ncbi:hypothetical protein Tco_1043806 [Tanacetum coccineum]|uniref:Uncharacterized protein n=1 Tax=Tanacetum coccineum TaxID=301880 RepID=A0ABQ5GPD1_9ASTR
MISGLAMPVGSMFGILNDGRLGDDLGVGLGDSCITTCGCGMMCVMGGLIIGLGSNDGGNECGGLGTNENKDSSRVGGLDGLDVGSGNWKKSSGELLYANVLNFNMNTYQYSAPENESCPQDSWHYLLCHVASKVVSVGCREKQALVDNIDDWQETLLGNKNIVLVGNRLGYRWWQGIAMGGAARFEGICRLDLYHIVTRVASLVFVLLLVGFVMVIDIDNGRGGFDFDLRCCLGDVSFGVSGEKLSLGFANGSQ